MLESLNGFKFIMAFLNLVVLYIVLRKVLFKPIMSFMENRTKTIENSIADAEKQKAQAMQMKADYEEQLKTAKAESKRIVEAAVVKAETRQADILAEAQKQAEELLAKAGKEIELEREQMQKELRNELAGLVFAAASKVLEANLDSDSNRLLIDKFIDEAGAA